jgi:hypothetical protein
VDFFAVLISLVWRVRVELLKNDDCFFGVFSACSMWRLEILVGRGMNW